MNNKALKAIRFATIVAMVTPFAFSEDQGNSDKILLKLSSIETSDTRAEKQFTPVMFNNLADNDLPYSPADLQKLSGADLLAAQQANNQAKMDHKAKAQKIAEENFRRAEQTRLAMISKFQQTQQGRRILTGVDRFSGYVGQYCNPSLIEYFDRLDNEEGDRENHLAKMKHADIAQGMYFVKLVVHDFKTETAEMAVSATYKLKNTKCTQKVTMELKNNSGIGRSWNFEETVTEAGDDVNGLLDQALDKCMISAAKALNEHFVATVTLNAISTPKSEEFSEDAVSLTIDGVTYGMGQPIALLKGKHHVVAECENYKTYDKMMSFTSDSTQKINMIYSMCEYSVKVKGPAGDADFDAANATIELTNGDDVNEAPSEDNPVLVSQGTYTLNVTMEGYKPISKKVTLTSAKKIENISMTKVAVPVTAQE